MLARCDGLQDEALNAIEEWQEIIPEAIPRTEIGVISSLKRDVGEFSETVVQLNKKLLDTEQRSDTERADLQKQLVEVGTKLRDTESALRAREVSLGSSVLSGLDVIGAPSRYLQGIRPEFSILNGSRVGLGTFGEHVNRGITMWKCVRCGALNTADCGTTKRSECVSCGMLRAPAKQPDVQRPEQPI
jgi:hypothetical protein